MIINSYLVNENSMFWLISREPSMQDNIWHSRRNIENIIYKKRFELQKMKYILHILGFCISVFLDLYTLDSYTNCCYLFSTLYLHLLFVRLLKNLVKLQNTLFKRRISLLEHYFFPSCKSELKKLSSPLPILINTLLIAK